MNVNMDDDKGMVNSETDTEDSDEELDPRVQLELEKLNAATDGINHLETEFGEAQALFQQMMQDATFQLKTMRSRLGKSVDKSKPYYEALIQAKYKHSHLHQAALKFEQAQSRHYNAKKYFKEAEKRVFASESRRIDPVLQEILNQATIEVNEAASVSKEAWERHREASSEFEEKQKNVQDLYNSLKKNISKSRPYFDLKMALNKQLEIQKQRLEKIQEGIQISKNVYSDILHNLEVISDDIHKARQFKQQSLLEPRGQGVGADSDNDDTSLPHNATMKRIRNTYLDSCEDTLSNFDTESTDSDVSSDNMLFLHDTNFQNSSPNSPAKHLMVNNDQETSSVSDNGNFQASATSSSASDHDYAFSAEEEGTCLTLHINKDFKEISNKVDSSYEVITSHSIPYSLPPFDLLDAWKDNSLAVLQSERKSRSFTDVSHFDYLYDETGECLKRCNSLGVTSKRRFSNFNYGTRRNSQSFEKDDKTVADTIAPLQT